MRTRSDCHYPSAVQASSPSAPPSSASNNAFETPPIRISAQPSFDHLDMTLMHRYATDTCKHLFTGARQIQVWQHDIPALAASNAALLHGILAVTAVHSAWRERDDPARRDLYRGRSLRHHTIGFPRFQQMVASASCETAQVVVAYSILLGIWMYAFPEIAAERQSLDEILTVVEATRGARNVFRLYRNTIMQSPMGVFLDPDPRCSSPTLASAGYLHSSAAQELLQHLQDQVLHHEADKGAVQQLQMFLDQHTTGLGHNRLAAAWMASVEDGYWARLRDGQPHAVLVFAYSTLLVRASEVARECWWIAGWSERILRACGDSIMSSPREVPVTVDWIYHERQIRAGADRISPLPHGERSTQT